MPTAWNTTHAEDRMPLPKGVKLGLLAILLAAALPAFAAPGDIPLLDWPRAMSDWLNVTNYGASGSDQNDDTAAIQAALNQMMTNCLTWTGPRVVYLPPGTYRISGTLSTDIAGGFLGGAIVGHGRATILKWTGASGGTMFMGGQSPHAWFEGLTWDGQGVAAFGMHHAAAVTGAFPTGIRHQNEAFLNFTTCGLWSGYSEGWMYSEMQVRNCLFTNCAIGIKIHMYNTYNHRIEQCEFRNCGIGINQEYWANGYIQECHFENSASYDVLATAETVGVSVRRCTSKGSFGFCWGKGLTVEGCVVEGWKNPTNAVYLDTGSKPALIFDTRFESPPAGAGPPIQVTQPGRLVMSNCQLTNGVANVVTNPNAIFVVPPGARGCALVDANQRFLKDTWPVPGIVKDLVQDFGAVRYGDATAAFQAGVAAVKALGNGAMLYIPSGNFLISSTIVLDGSNYMVSGFGGGLNQAHIAAASGFTGAAFELRNAQNVSLRQLAIQPMDVRQTSVAGGTSSTTYDSLSLVGGTLRLENLPAHSTVDLVRLSSGSLFVTNCSQARILGHFVNAQVTVAGTSAKTGLLGILTLNGVPENGMAGLDVRNNQDVIVSDYYFEQAHYKPLKLAGGAGQPAGRVTLGMARSHAYIAEVGPAEVVVTNYQGRLGIFTGTWEQEGGTTFLQQTGTQPVWIAFMAGGASLTPNVTTNASLAYARNDDRTDKVMLGGLDQAAAALDDFAELGRLSLDVGGYASATQAMDLTPPAVPGGVVAQIVDASRDPRQVQVSWSAVNEADCWGYNVYRSVNGLQPIRLHDTVLTGTGFLDVNAPAGATYTYSVTAVDRAGNESQASTVAQDAGPAVSLTLPTNGTPFSAPAASITIQATASDTDGTVTNVAFYQGTTLLGHDATSPYSYTWTSVPAGSYSLTARAFDNAGAVTVSKTVGIQVGAPPTVGITAPAAGSVFTTPASITITATAADTDGTVTNVAFYQGGTLLGQDATSPYSYAWSGVAFGSYGLTARAYDNAGIVTTSAVVNAQVNASGAKTVVWNGTGSTNEWNTSLDNWVGTALFATGDTVQFDNSSPNGAVFIGTNGVPVSVSPARTFLHYYGRTWTFAGGDILTGSMTLDWDSNVYFKQNDLSFPGGFTNTHPNGRLYFQPGGGEHHFGAGPISLSGGSGGSGQFNFEPTAPATLVNAVVIGSSGGSFSGNSNAVYTGDVTVNGPVRAVGRNCWSNRWVLTADRTITIPNSYMTASWSIFNGIIDGGGSNTVTITDGSAAPTTDYFFQLGGPGNWNVKNVIKSGGNGICIVPNSATFFAGVKANGGQVIVLQGRLAPSTGNSFNSKSGVYDVTADYVVSNGGARIQGETINIYCQGRVTGPCELVADQVNLGLESYSPGILAPGFGVGTLTNSGNLAINGAGVLNLDLGTPGVIGGVTNDLLVVKGNLTLNGGTINVTATNGFGAGLYVLIAYSGVQDGGGSLTLGTFPANYTASIYNDPDNKQIRMQVVPLGANLPPLVSITAPANGWTSTAPATITIEATATDADGTVTNVAFYQGGTLLGQDTNAPFSFVWTPMTPGDYALTARAWDNAGAVVTSTVVNIHLDVKLIVWDGTGPTNEWNRTVDNWVGNTLYGDGDTVQFDNTSPSATIFIGSNGVPMAVSPAHTFFHFSGRTWTFSGGDILTGAMAIDWDSSLYFKQNDLSFPGGFTNSHGNARVYFQPGGGVHRFGTGPITLSGGSGSSQFNFQPTASAILTNAFIIGATGGSLSGNSNAVFTGDVAVNGSVRASGRNCWSNRWLLSGDRTITIPDSSSPTAWSIFNGFIDGGGSNSVTVTDGSVYPTTDYCFQLGGPGNWNVKNVIKTGGNGICVVTNSATFFNSIKANGGQVIVLQGRLAPASGNAFNNKSGTYNVTLACTLTNGGARIQADAINIYSNGSVTGLGELYANNVFVGSNSPGILSPGFGVGILTNSGNLTIHAAGVLNVDLGTPGVIGNSTNDLLAVQGNLTINGGTVNVAATNGFGTGAYVLIAYTGTSGGTGTLKVGAMPARYKLTITNDTTSKQVKLNVAVAKPTGSIILVR